MARYKISNEGLKSSGYISDFVEQKMTDHMCEMHRFNHLSPKDVTIKSIKSSYDNILMKFIVDGVTQYGRLRSEAYIDETNAFVRYAFEMSEECANGFNKVDNVTFQCEDRRGILVPATTKMCQIGNKHDTLEVFTDKMVDEDSVCCVFPINKLTQYPSLMIGDKCTLTNRHFVGFLGICKWKGKINGIECIGAEMTDWVSNECNGTCLGSKIFDCRSGHGMLLRCSDIVIDEISPYEFVFGSNGFVDPKCIYHAKKTVMKTKEVLQIGRRVKLIYIENRCSYTRIFGVIKWLGTVNKGKCVGIELDYPCDGGMDGTINCYESFTCESGCGAILPVDSVSFDQYCYSVSFTVEETFNVDYNFSYKESWDQDIIHERNLKLNTEIFVHIEKHDRILSLKGTIMWCGYIKCVSVAILKLTDSCTLTYQEKICHIMNKSIPASYIIVHTQYLFRYRQLKSYERMEDTLIDLDLAKTTEFGMFRWRGVDTGDDIYYGFETESPQEKGSDGTFCGQKLFQCQPGCGVLIPLQTIIQSIKSKRYNSLTIPPTEPVGPKEPKVTLDDKTSLLPLVISILKNDKISTNEIVSCAIKVENPSILPLIVDNMTSSIYVSEYSDLVNQMVKLGSFETLSVLIEKCLIKDDDSKIFLKVASEFLKNNHYKYFERCMHKCTNRDVLMDDGETFVTYVIKEKVDQRMIIAAITDFEFDLTKSNVVNEEPLTLACGNVMTDVVAAIMKYIKSQEARKKACLICMDREIDTVFNCGHNSCTLCASNIDYCPVCKVDIKSRGKLYFN